MPREIFVFGSNLAGAHYGGSARHAWENHGAEFGKGIGLYGNSYAIPTLNTNFEKLPLEQIDFHVGVFLLFAKYNPTLTFNIVAIGTGIAGFKSEEIALMFKDAPENCNLPKEFKEFLCQQN